MLVGSLPEIRDTQVGKDLISIGKIEGKIEAKIEDLLLLMQAKFGEVPDAVQERINKLESVEVVDRLLLQLLKVDSIDQMNW